MKIVGYHSKIANSKVQLQDSSGEEPVLSTSLVNLFNFAQNAERPDWKNRAATVLAEHVDRLVRESENTDFIFDFGQYLYSPGLKEYNKALRLFSQLLEKSGQDRRKADTAYRNRNSRQREDQDLHDIGKAGARDRVIRDAARD